MGNGSSGTGSFGLRVLTGAVVALGLMVLPALAQRAVSRDPAEPAQGKPQPKMLARPAVSVKDLVEIQEKLEEVQAELDGENGAKERSGE